jgi:hypothetical protein
MPLGPSDAGHRDGDVFMSDDGSRTRAARVARLALYTTRRNGWLGPAAQASRRNDDFLLRRAWSGEPGLSWAEPLSAIALAFRERFPSGEHGALV